MKKIKTLFKKDPNDLSKVVNEVDPENEWVIRGEGIPMRKWDGTACAIINGLLYKRYDVKKGRVIPEGAIPCQEPDTITGHWPHWVLCDKNNPADKWHFDAKDVFNRNDGTYELIGPKVQGNPEKSDSHLLIPHKDDNKLHDCIDLSFNGLMHYLTTHDYEGIVFHHRTDERMCKIRKSDFGIKR